ncbi:RNase adapter RapZ [Chondromyces crocatus]|uniref:Nucleotide-binding protein n=1 Tax=Chondromyces crocatus TaxID=52 RepID=A0A0K1EE63_CHOCO|nr:RNase adapter RapZ [Chondromyces crocatus]AKT39134.1 nucleotide-binding protein [Chondromyces crocatus]
MSEGRSSDEPGRVAVVTGLSGAGKSTAIRALEDLGFFCVDNMPPPLVERAVEVCEAGGVNRIGLGIDVRVGAFIDGASAALKALRARRDVFVLFLDASDDVLIRRFSETRRPHPLIARGHGEMAMLDGLVLERERLASLRAQATIELDTSRLSVHELRRLVIERVGSVKQADTQMATRVVSFGYKYGVPLDADLLFDVRFLDNPYFVPELRPLTGNDAAVRDYILQNPDALAYVERVEQLLLFSVPRYAREGKSYLTIGIGCTGGRHRSVALAVLLGERLRGKTGLPVAVIHRDLSRGVTAAAPSSGSVPSDLEPSAGLDGAHVARGPSRSIVAAGDQVLSHKDAAGRDS